MSDTKIRGLTEITTAEEGDFIQLVDISDTTWGTNGTNKQVTIANLFASEILTLNIGTVINIGTTTSTATEGLNLVAGTTAANGIYFGTDTNLYRTAANSLRTDDYLTVGGSTTTVLQFKTYTSGTSGGVLFGDSAGSYDTNLYRSAANELFTDDNFTAGGTALRVYDATSSAKGLMLGDGAGGYDCILYRQAANQFRTEDQLVLNNLLTLGNDGTRSIQIYTGDKPIEFGDGAGGFDTNLYRSAANVLKTDDNFSALGYNIICNGDAVVCNSNQVITN